MALRAAEPPEPCSMYQGSNSPATFAPWTGRGVRSAGAVVEPEPPPRGRLGMTQGTVDRLTLLSGTRVGRSLRPGPLASDGPFDGGSGQTWGRSWCPADRRLGGAGPWRRGTAATSPPRSAGPDVATDRDHLYRPARPASQPRRPPHRPDGPRRAGTDPANQPVTILEVLDQGRPGACRPPPAAY